VSPAEPLVSVGIPTYDRPEGLRKALEIVLGQSYRNLEVIVSDNASPGDATERVVMELASRDGRVRYHRQPENLGPQRNFNFVLQQATGKYFAWIADDDLCDEHFFGELVPVLERDPEVALTMCDVTVIKIEDDGRQEATEARLDSLRSEETDRAWPRVRRRFFAYPTSNIFLCIYGVYRTEVLRRCRIGFTSRWKGITYAVEVPLLAQIAVQGKIVSLPRTLKTWVMHPGSTFIREKKWVGPLDRVIRNFELRCELTRIALQSRLRWTDKVQLAVYPWVSRVLLKIQRVARGPVILSE
jgi:glycosyltransferase involved in cell wall biosynthesis